MSGYQSTSTSTMLLRVSFSPRHEPETLPSVQVLYFENFDVLQKFLFWRCGSSGQSTKHKTKGQNSHSLRWQKNKNKLCLHKKMASLRREQGWLWSPRHAEARRNFYTASVSAPECTINTTISPDGLLFMFVHMAALFWLTSCIDLFFPLKFNQFKVEVFRI